MAVALPPADELPPVDELAARGLVDVTVIRSIPVSLDLPLSPSPLSASSSLDLSMLSENAATVVVATTAAPTLAIHGSATFTPNPHMPLLDESTASGFPRRVQFRFVPLAGTSPAAMRDLEKDHQMMKFLVKERSAPRLRLEGSRSSSLSNNSPPLLAGQLPSAAVIPSPEPPPVWPFLNRVLASQLDSRGVWTIFADPGSKEVTTLENYWQRALMAVAREEENAGGYSSDGLRDESSRERTAVFSAYAEALEALIQPVQICIDLLERRLVMALSRPELFQVVCSPASESHERCTPPKVELKQFHSIVQLSESTIDGSGIDGGGDESSPNFMLHSPTSDHYYTALEEQDVLRRHLRYLAPETVNSRAISGSVSSIYSLGVVFHDVISSGSSALSPTSAAAAAAVFSASRQTGGLVDDLLTDIHRHLTTDLPPLPTALAHPPRSPTATKVVARLSEIVARCTARDMEERYSSFRSILYDLQRLQQLCRAEGDIAKFEVGKVDALSRFKLPRELIDRADETLALDKAFSDVRIAQHTTTVVPSVVTVWGLSGSGKSKLVERWAARKEATDDDGQGILIGRAKMDQYQRKPLAGFISVFESLLNGIFSNPKEDADLWRSKITDILPGQVAIFLSLISPSWHEVLIPTRSEVTAHTPIPETPTDWQNFLPTFRQSSKRLLQIFASSHRPLVIILDDVQWLSSEELDLWKDIFLDHSHHRLKNVLCLNLYRIEGEDSPPPPATLLCKSSILVHIKSLGEAGVDAFLTGCLHFQKADLRSNHLASFLYHQTGGNPLFLQSLITSLVQNRVICFDFQLLKWTFDLHLLQSHASSGVDQYLERMLSALPKEAQHILGTLACFPSRGLSPERLSLLTGKTLRETELLLQTAEACGSIVISKQNARFSHDRMLLAAYRLIPENLVGEVHCRIGQLLRSSPALLEIHLFDAVDNSLTAQEKGYPIDEPEKLARLVYQAAKKATRSASLKTAMAYLVAAGRLVDFWAKESWEQPHLRNDAFNYACLYSEVSALNKNYSPAIDKMLHVLQFCDTDCESLKIRTLLVRLYIASNEHQKAIAQFSIAMDDVLPDRPSTIPETVEDIAAMVSAMESRADVALSEREQLEVGIISLVAFCGATLFITGNGFAFPMAVAVCMRSPAVLQSEGASYVIATFSLHDVRSPKAQHAFVNLALELLEKRSYHEPGTRVVCTAQSHSWLRLEDVNYDQAFEASTQSMNDEMLSYSIGLDFATRVLDFKPIAVHKNRFVSWYQRIGSFTPPARILIDLPLQAAELMSDSNSGSSKPWTLDGVFLCPERDLPAIDGLVMHQTVWTMFSLLLGIYFDAPKEDLAKIIEGAHPSGDAAVQGCVYQTELSFLRAAYHIQHGSKVDQQTFVADDIAHLNLYKHVTDFRMRLLVLEALQSLRFESEWTKMIINVESALEVLMEEKFLLLAGFLQARTAIWFLERRPRVAYGYAVGAHEAFSRVGAYALAQRIATQVPDAFHRRKSSRHATIISSLLRVNSEIPPELKSSATTAKRGSSEPAQEPSNNIRSNSTVSRVSQTLSTATDSGSVPSEDMASSGGINGTGTRSLDATLLRTSLLLVSEKDKDPAVLVSQFMRLVLQFVRADFGAFALYDTPGNTLSLRAAGSYDGMTPFDLPLAEAETIAPAAILLHVARTGKTISNPTTVATLREPFFGGRLPRTLLCLPLMNRAGVVFLSSRSIASEPPTSAQIEAIQCVSAFATIALEASLSQRRLESLVSDRTRQLSKALDSKNLFLSTMSHELRTPLTAVLGLASVLADASDLTSVQRELIAQIIASGMDLQAVISNILDLSKLESNQVKAESIQMSMREVIESALDSVAVRAHTKDIEVLLETPFTDDPPPILSDPFRIKQILLNYLSNATKFTDTGTINIGMTYSNETSDSIRIVVYVEDTGCGIPASEMDRLFLPFSQVNDSITRTFGGSGLGLAIGKRLAGVLGGDAWAESTVGVGSKFYFSIVALVDPAPPPQPELTLFPPKTAMIICPIIQSRLTLEKNLIALGFTSITTSPSFKMAGDDMVKAKRYDLCVLNPEHISRQELGRLQTLQPQAIVRFATRVIDLSGTLEKFGIQHSDIITRPVRVVALRQSLEMAFAPNRSKARATQLRFSSGMNTEFAKSHPLNILLVDDNRVNTVVGRKILERFGYDSVDIAYDGQQAVEAAERKRYDLNFMDLSMPVMDGITSHKRISASPIAGSPVVVALTANTDKGTQDLVGAEAFFAYLAKPLNIPAFGKVLKDAFVARSAARSA